MNKKRLLKLADLLEKDARNKKGIKFDLNTWASPAGRKKLFANDAPKLDCTTAACAMGLACLSGEFKRAGLGFSINGPSIFSAHAYLIPTLNGMGGWHYGVPSELFDIGEDVAEWMFSPGMYPRKYRKGAEGERRVAKRIREFVTGKAAP